MDAQFKQIALDQAKEIIDQRDVTIVDIRDQDSFQLGHIANAISVNEENIKSFLETTAKNKTLICYCYHGISSQGAADYFAQNGFKEVYSIEGGFEAWKTIYQIST